MTQLNKNVLKAVFPVAAAAVLQTVTPRGWKTRRCFPISSRSQRNSAAPWLLRGRRPWLGVYPGASLLGPGRGRG